MATKKREAQWGKAKETGEKASKTDDQKDHSRSKMDSRDSRRSPSKIKSRVSGSTREVNPIHVVELAESIEALGLLQPIAIDNNDNLVAGEHRLIACQMLALKDENARVQLWESTKLCSVKNINRIEGLKQRVRSLDHSKFIEKYKDLEIPVLVLPFDSAKDVEQGLLAETAENEKRINYSKEEIRNIADKLKSVGYIEKIGRPKDGEKSLKNALTVISGKSWRQIYRDMNDSKTLTHVRVFDERRELNKLLKLIENIDSKAFFNEEFKESLNKVIKVIKDRLQL